MHPEYPPEGIPRADLYRRYGEAHLVQLRETFALAGLGYNPPPDVVPNTRAALRLTELARAQGRHAAAHDRLMLAYWEEARNIGDPEVLRSLAAELDLDNTDAAIAGDRYGDEVDRHTAQAQAIGINAIPAFLLNRRLIILGAQPEPVFERAFEQLEAELAVSAE